MWIQAANRALMQIIPLIIVGAIGFMLNNFPISQYQDFMAAAVWLLLLSRPLPADRCMDFFIRNREQMKQEKREEKAE